MNIKTLGILCMLLIAGITGSFAQSATTDSLQGDWEIERAVMKVYAQRGGQLLTEKTITDPGQIAQLRSLVPFSMLFKGDQYEAGFNGVTESGRYFIEPGTLRLKSNVAEMPEVSWPYRITGDFKLQVTLPHAYYKDVESNQPVKQLVICQLRRKP